MYGTENKIGIPSCQPIMKMGQTSNESWNYDDEIDND
jgi:hypothetical protein